MRIEDLSPSNRAQAQMVLLRIWLYRKLPKPKNGRRATDKPIAQRVMPSASLIAGIAAPELSCLGVKVR